MGTGSKEDVDDGLSVGAVEEVDVDSTVRAVETVLWVMLEEDV